MLLKRRKPKSWSTDAPFADGSAQARKRRKSGRLWVVLLVALIGVGAWHQLKPLPSGVHLEPPAVGVAPGDLAFLYDLTSMDEAGEAVIRQEIFDEVFSIIDRAKEFIVLDFFLVNDHLGKGATVHRPLSTELLERLERRKRADPYLDILFITDPINDVYGGDPSPVLEGLREAGIEVVLTDLTRLRDTNPAYSALWHVLLRWFGNSPDGGWFPHPFDEEGEKVTLRSWAALLNFKANHRKIIVADDGGDDLVALVTSANPHDASSAHSNVAFKVSGAPAHYLLVGEVEVARFSGWSGEIHPPSSTSSEEAREGPIEVRVLTEGAIRSELLATLAEAGPGSRVDAALFYLSDRKVVGALLEVAARGAEVRLVLDPNRDAFGKVKSGIPNRPVATELVDKSGGAIQVRWYETHGEQFHTKLVIVRTPERVTATLGSANLTRRNLADLNLEANVQAVLPPGSALARELEGYFETIWQNRGGNLYTVDFEEYRDASQVSYWRYWIEEVTGLSTF